MIAPLFVIILLAVLLIVVTPHINARSYNLGKSINNVNIPDIIHNNIVAHAAFKTLAALLPVVSFQLCIIAIVVNKRVDMLVFLIVCAIVFQILFYAITVATTLPDSSKECKFNKNVFEMLKHMGTCNNLGISGHLMFTGLLLFVASWTFHDHKHWGYFAALYVLSFISISASRNHYTLDCIVSTLLLGVLISNAKSILEFLNKRFKFPRVQEK